MNTGFRKFVFSVLLMGITFFAYKYMIKPANLNLEKQQLRVQEKIGKLAQFQKATATAEDLTSQLKKFQEVMNFFESKLPPTSEIYKVLEQVTLIAQKHKLTPRTVKTMDKKDNSGYVEQPLKMELTGDFNAFYSYLLELEQLPRIMKIREIKLAKSQTEEGIITADFVVSIFFQKV